MADDGVARVGFDCSVDTIGVGAMKTGEFVATMLEEGEELFDVLIEYAQVLATESSRGYNNYWQGALN